MKLLKEPLFHFLVLGAFLFVLNDGLNRPGEAQRAGGTTMTRVTSNDVARLKETWIAQQQRLPTDVELQGLLSTYVKELLLSSGARDLGLDRNDAVVRRRLSDRMVFLLEETSRLVDPSDKELADYFDRYPGRFDDPAFVTFTQIYFSREKRGDAGLALAKEVLVELQSSVTPSDAGDSALFPKAYVKVGKDALSGQFGAAFAESVFALETQHWDGPFESQLGYHLVWVTEKVERRSRSLDEAKPQVVAAWREEKVEQALQDKLRELNKTHAIEADASVEALLEPILAELEQ